MNRSLYLGVRTRLILARIVEGRGAQPRGQDHGDSDEVQFMDKHVRFMMTSSNGNIFRVTDPLRGEFSGR